MLDALLICKGHPYEREPFYAIFDAMEGVDWTLVEQPAAQALFDVDAAARYDAFVLYDMPGIQFNPQPREPPAFEEPSAKLKQGLQALLDAGQGFVFLHHAIAGWPAWPEYGDLIGGRFLYLPQALRGAPRPDSGYRHKVTHTISTVGEHPVLDGIPDSFQITDELYLGEVFEDEVTPLLRSDYNFVAENFYSATLAVQDGQMFSNEGWQHEAGSNLIGWAKEVNEARIVYLQCGDDPEAYANPHFQRLIANAIRWVAKEQN